MERSMDSSWVLYRRLWQYVRPYRGAFALAMLGQNQIIVLTALSLIGAMGSYMPPVALTPVVTAKLIGVNDYGEIAKLCFWPAVAAVLVGLLMIVFANPIAAFLGV